MMTEQEIEEIVERMKTGSDEDRLQILQHFCAHCGHIQDAGRPCQCINDE